MNVERAFRSWVDGGASWILWLLLGLSVVSVAVILERFVFFLRTRANVAALREELNRGVKQEEPAELERRLHALPSLEARIVSAGLGAACPEAAEERLVAEAQLQRLRAEQNLAFLGTLGNNAPFVGLLGTVLGIIGAFEQLDASRGQLTTGLMAEIGEALVATAVGLLVALPAVAAYNAFQRTIHVRVTQGDALGRELIAHLRAQGGGAPAVGGE